ncbi:hypothetical protein [Saccharopolyspora sp. NPDC050642]|uniref:hypothetical protein n=1 Tax=Saccharopolyspora sp. NPDC050642 TaxID=3157099 RepID=UPI0033C2B244
MGGVMIHEFTLVTLLHAAAIGAGVLALVLCFTAAGYVRNCSGQHAGAGDGATTVRQLQDLIAAEARRHAAAEYVGRHRLR